jgi:hypothetical protein
VEKRKEKMFKRNVPQWLRDGLFFKENLAELQDEETFPIDEKNCKETPSFTTLDEFYNFIHSVNFFMVDIEPYMCNILSFIEDDNQFFPIMNYLLKYDNQFCNHLFSRLKEYRMNEKFFFSMKIIEFPKLAPQSNLDTDLQYCIGFSLRKGLNTVNVSIYDSVDTGVQTTTLKDVFFSFYIAYIFLTRDKLNRHDQRIIAYIKKRSNYSRLTDSEAIYNIKGKLAVNKAVHGCVSYGRDMGMTYDDGKNAIRIYFDNEKNFYVDLFIPREKRGRRRYYDEDTGSLDGNGGSSEEEDESHVFLHHVIINNSIILNSEDRQHFANECKKVYDTLTA